MKELLLNLKNPFVKESKSGLWVAAIALGAAAAGTAAWFFLRKRENEEETDGSHEFPYHSEVLNHKRPKSDVGSLHTIVA